MAPDFALDVMTINPLLLDLPEHIATERLTMRPPRPGDGAALLPALSETIPALRRFLGSLPWVAADTTAETTELFCRNAHANFAGRKDFPFFLFEKSSGDIVGVAGLHRPEWTVPKAEVGYWGRTSRNGQGLVTEGVRALCDYAFTHFQAVRLEAVTDEENIASRRVAERCGFTLEGTFRNDRRTAQGDLRSTCIYARLAGHA
jgi:RimJ/RimL family protein N-acetyltransferase